ncbi:glycosyltransferase family 4 protein [Methylobacterium sp. AMS5]|uniref:glycosyltransferase family 4 protein n=1 Tax=Methylobacterium sp. AMS5 TaxID=925818 RepID=UPI0009F81513|nr:glycosyltransferase family 4 protein [Methylobacterium sp. AMS5]
MAAFQMIIPDAAGSAAERRTIRTLICDFDFYSALGGGQTFYRRVVERHPDWTILYPSRGRDLTSEIRSRLPTNAHPYGFDRFLYPWDLLAALKIEGVEERSYALIICQIAVPLQGQFFDVVEVPSFFPVAHLIRPIFAAFGIGVRTISLGMLGWLSVSNRNAYASEVPEVVIERLEEMERRCIAGADVSYTISDLHAAENDQLKPSAVVDMHDALDTLPAPTAYPPGEGPPDLWFVGRLDRNKGPDLFIEIASQIPRSLYRNCYLCGPDNPWASSGPRWSETVLELARERQVPAEYLGEISHDELWSRAFRGRSVIVIPSRSDAFNYVAVEATMSGAPILLSKQAGAAAFLEARHTDIAPPIIDPDDLTDAAAKLERLLGDYEGRTAHLRKTILEGGWPAPRNDFFADVIGSAPAGSGRTDSGLLERARSADPLNLAPARIWRSVAPPPAENDIEIVLRAGQDRRALERSLTSLRTPDASGLAVTILVEAGQELEDLPQLLRSFHPGASLLRTGSTDTAAAINEALEKSRAAALMLLNAGDSVEGGALRRLFQALQAIPAADLAIGLWSELDAFGAVLRDHQADAFDMRALIGPGGRPGGILMRRSDHLLIDESMGDCGLLDLYGRLSTAPVVRSAERIGWSWPAAEDAAASRRPADLSPLLRKWLLAPPRADGRDAA